MMARQYSKLVDEAGKNDRHTFCAGWKVKDAENIQPLPVSAFRAGRKVKDAKRLEQNAQTEPLPASATCASRKVLRF